MEKDIAFKMENFFEIFPNLPCTGMIYLKGGEFMMGSNSKEAFDSEKPVHKVQVCQFYIGQYPVTQALWQHIMGNNPSHFKGSRRPVEQVSWEDVQKFISKLNTVSERIYRLPTEAEWEYAARGGNQSKSYAFSGSDKLSEVGWYVENAHEESKPLGLKRENELGLFDMCGNVFEWCQDWYDDNYYKYCVDGKLFNNPKGPSDGELKVVRGGCWSYLPIYCRSTNRDGSPLSSRDNDMGFRLVSTPV